MTIGQRIYNLRTENGLTQEQLSEKLEVSRQSISKWELDKALPDIQKLIEMSKLYEVTIDYIILGNEPDVKDNNEIEKELRYKETKSGVVITGKTEQTESVMNKTETTGIGLNGEGKTGSRKTEFDISESDSSEPYKVKTHNNTMRYITLFVALVCIFMGIMALALELRLAGDFVFNSKGKNADMVRIGKIYEQYTKADVTEVDDAGNSHTKQVWLDTPNVKEGEFIYAYHSGEDYSSMKFEYYKKTLLAPLMIMIVSVAASIILILTSIKKYNYK
ncbi:MAG: helix-turn-helix transcriptional regulator [Lachnospiraceae bacterium]|nr:helix-turn-helix transcriptional regulator [Lachnospiraceae bacterium]